MRTIAQEVEFFMGVGMRPSHIKPGRIGYCETCRGNRMGNLIDEGMGRDDAYGRSIVHEDWVNRCPEDGTELGAPAYLTEEV